MDNFPGSLGNLDQLGLVHAPRRVVSLVPSMTETLFAWGLSDRVVGVTDYCVYPAEATEWPKVGGVKTPDLDRVRAAMPDLILANPEENRKDDIVALQAQGYRVWLTYPRTVAEALEVLWAMVRVFEVAPLGKMVDTLERTYEWADLSADTAPVRVFCPIWKDAQGWMTIGPDTYVHDLLRACGGHNVFADLTEGPRYPRVTTAEILARAPEVIVLPSEPYPFVDDDARPIQGQARVIPVDGSLLTWHGIRLARALAELPALLAPIPHE